MKNKNTKSNKGLTKGKISKNIFSVIMLICLFTLVSVSALASWHTYQGDIQSRGIQMIPYEIPENLTINNASCNDGNGYQIETGNFDTDWGTKEFVVMCGSRLEVIDTALNKLDTYEFGSGKINGNYEIEDMNGDGDEDIIMTRDTGSASEFVIFEFDRASASLSKYSSFSLNNDYSSLRCVYFSGQERCFVNDDNVLRAFDIYDNSISDDWLDMDLGGEILNKPVVVSDFDKDGDNDICTAVPSLNQVICIDENRQVSLNVTGDFHEGIQTIQLVYDNNKWYFLLSWGYKSIYYTIGNGYLRFKGHSGLSLVDKEGDEELDFEINQGEGRYDVASGNSLVWMDDIDNDLSNEFCMIGDAWTELLDGYVHKYRIICKENNLFETTDVDEDMNSWSALNVIQVDLANVEYENYTGKQIITSDGIYGFNESLNFTQIETYDFNGYVTVDDLDMDSLSDLMMVEGSYVRLFGLSEGNTTHLPIIEDYDFTPATPTCGYDSTINVEFNNFEVYDGDGDTQFKLITYCDYPDPYNVVQWSYTNESSLYTVCSFDPNITSSYEIKTYITDLLHENWSLNELNSKTTVYSVQDKCTHAPIITYSHRQPRTICKQGIESYTLDVVDGDGDTLFATYTDCDMDGLWDKRSDFVTDDELGGNCYYDGDSRTQYFQVWVTDESHFTESMDYGALDDLDSVVFYTDIDSTCNEDNLMPYIESYDVDRESPVCLDQDVLINNFSIYDYENETLFSLWYYCEEGGVRQGFATAMEDELYVACDWTSTGDKEITVYVTDEFHNDLSIYPLESLQSITLPYTVLDAGQCTDNLLPVINSISLKPSEHICVNESLVGYNFDVTDLDNDKLFQLIVDCGDGNYPTTYSYNTENSLTFICDYETAGTYNITMWITDLAHEEFDYLTYNNFTVQYDVWDNASCNPSIINTSNSTCEGHCLFKDYFPYDDQYYLHGWSILDSSYNYDYWSFPFGNEMYFSESGRKYLRVYIDNSNMSAYPISTLTFNMTLYNEDEFSLSLLDYYNDLEAPITEIVWFNGNIQYQDKDTRFTFSGSPYLCYDCYDTNSEHSYKLQVYWNLASISTDESIEEDYSLVFFIDDVQIGIIPFAMAEDTTAIKEGFTGSLNFNKGYSTKFSMDDIYYYRGTNPDFDNTGLVIFSNHSVEFDGSVGGWDSTGKFNCNLYPECCARIDGELKVVKTFCAIGTVFDGWGSWILSWIKSNPLLFIVGFAFVILVIPVWLKLRENK